MSNKHRLQHAVETFVKARKDTHKRVKEAIEQAERVRQVRTEQPNR